MKTTLQRFLEANSTRQMIVNFDAELGKYFATITQKIGGFDAFLASGQGGDVITAIQNAEKDLIEVFALK